MKFNINLGVKKTLLNKSKLKNIFDAINLTVDKNEFLPNIDI